MLGTIGLFLRTFDNDYQQRLKEFGLREAKRQGFDVVVEAGQNDANKQAEQIHAALKSAAKTKMVAVLVSSVRDAVMPDLARETAEAGLDFALLNEGLFIEEVRSQYPKRAVFAVTPDQAEIGRIHGRQVQSLLGDKGKVLTVTGPVSMISAQRRLDGLREVLSENFSIVELNADWTSERARMEVERWASKVSGDDELPGMFVGHNDEMALGIRQALRDAASQHNLPLADAWITGCDGSQTFGQRLVREGRIKATVIMPPASGAAVEWIGRVRAHGELPPARVIQPVTSFPAISSLKK